MADPVDLGCAEAVHQPAAYFGAALERGDVLPHVDRGWAVIGHEAVAAAFRDSDTLSADRVSVLERVAARRPESFRLVVDLLSGWMIFRDPPEHTRLREPVRDAFTPRRVGGLRPAVEAIVEQAFDTMEAEAVEGAGDLTTHVARPVPALVVGALLGVDPADRPKLQAWSDDLAAIVFSLDPSSTSPATATSAAEAFRDFFGPMVDAVGPGDGGLVARIAALDTSFSRLELIGMCTMLLFAGHETTTSLLQQMTAELLVGPELVDQLRAPGADLGLAVDEFLRVRGPARTMVRKARVDHERGRTTIRSGDTMFLSIAGANHDRRVFDAPDRWDLQRDPNPHLGFGWGLHHCLGAQLARLEATVFLEVLLRRHDELVPARPVPPLQGAVMGFGRGPVHLRLPA